MKDAKGHGSNGRSGSAVSARENGRRERERTRLAALMQEGKITNQLAQRDADDAARTSLASGPKSAPAPIHGAMDLGPTHDRANAGMGPAPAHWSAADQASYNKKNGY